MSRRLLATSVLALGLLTAACTGTATPIASTSASAAGSTAPSVSASASAAASVAASASAATSPGASVIRDTSLLGTMSGSWSTMIPSGVNAQPGIWKLAIDDAGVFLTHPQGNRFQPGEVLDVTPTELVLGPDPGCPGQGTPTEGRYQWRIDGDTLAFELVSDSCRDRADTLTTSDWSLTP